MNAKLREVFDWVKANTQLLEVCPGVDHDEVLELDRVSAQFNGSTTHTGGGIFVALIRVSETEVIGVGQLSVALYRREEGGDVEDIFFGDGDHCVESICLDDDGKELVTGGDQ